MASLSPCRAGDESVRTELGSIFAALANAKSPGLAVLVEKNGRTLFQAGYGVRDLRRGAKIDAGTNFRLASVTKQFTAMTVMLLVHDGKLRYDQKLTDVFPDFPAYGSAITIRHLLTHTSGLPDYEDLMDKAEKAKRGVWSPQHQIQDGEVLDLLRRETHGKFAPGASWSYSNSGFVVLGLVAAKISGQPFEKVLNDRIFAPLGMTNTVAYVKGRNSPVNRAFGHTRTGDKFIETDQSSTSATLGDGGVYSNLTDLAKWDRALSNHFLLSENDMEPAVSEARLADGSVPRWPAQPGEDNLDPGQPVRYGFGWFLDPYKGRPRMWHFGSSVGFRTAIERFTERKLTVIVLANRTDLDPAALALKAADRADAGR